MRDTHDISYVVCCLFSSHFNDFTIMNFVLEIAMISFKNIDITYLCVNKKAGD